MRYLSTRHEAAPVCLDTALAAGLAPDGGLYVPETLPQVAIGSPDATLAETAKRVLAPFFAESALRLQLDALCTEAFFFDAPLRALSSPNDYLLELFHGPTAAFKDYGARLLAGALSRLRAPDAPTTTILVATSGDTGAAVAAAFHHRPGFEVVILYPHARVSPRQAHGLGCWGDNVRAYRLDGDFDDCQQLAKRALSDARLRAQISLSSANSISLGRLLPQVAYYAHAALRLHAEHGRAPNFIVPTGNLGNALAAWIARRMGLPIGEIVLASNANDTLSRYFAGADYVPQPTRATLANAMDVGAPSNFERLRHWHRDDAELRAAMRAQAVDDMTIRETIRHAPARHGVVPCPHTATGLHVLEHLRAQSLSRILDRSPGQTRSGHDPQPWVVVATAHPAKFESIVEPLVGHPIPPPPGLAAALARPAFAEAMPADYAALRERLLSP